MRLPDLNEKNDLHIINHTFGSRSREADNTLSSLRVRSLLALADAIVGVSRIRIVFKDMDPSVSPVVGYELNLRPFSRYINEGASAYI